MTTAYQTLLQNFALHIGMDNPADLVIAGEIVIDDLPVSLIYEDEIALEQLVCISDLGKPTHAGDGVYRRLLEANLLWKGTGGATLGIHADSGRVMLAHKYPIEGLNVEGLARLLEHFVAVALHWKSVVEGLPSTPTAGTVHLA